MNTSESDKTQAKAEAPQESEEPAAEAPSEEASDSSFVNAAKTVTIPGGLSSDGVAQILYNEGIIDNPSSFNKYLIDRGVDRVIRSGTKDFPEGATYEQIASIITH